MMRDRPQFLSIILILCIICLIPYIKCDHGDVELIPVINQTCIVFSSQIDYLDYLEHRPPMNITQLFPNHMVNLTINDTCDLSNFYQFPIVTIDQWSDFIILYEWLTGNETISENALFDFTRMEYFFEFLDKVAAGQEFDGKTSMTSWLCYAAVDVKKHYKLVNKTDPTKYKTGLALEAAKLSIEFWQEIFCDSLSMVTNFIEGFSVNTNETHPNEQHYIGPPVVYNKDNSPHRNNRYLNRVAAIFTHQLDHSIIKWKKREQITQSDETKFQRYMRRAQNGDGIANRRNGWGTRINRYFGLNTWQKGKRHFFYETLPFYTIGLIKAVRQHTAGNHPLKRGLWDNTVHRVKTMMGAFNVYNYEKHYLASILTSRIWKVLKTGWNDLPGGYNSDGILKKVIEHKQEQHQANEFNNEIDTANPWLFINSIYETNATTNTTETEEENGGDPVFDPLMLFFPSSWINPEWTGYGPNDLHNLRWCFPADWLSKILYHILRFRSYDSLQNVPFIYVPTNISECLLYPGQFADPELPGANCSLGIYQECPDILTDENRDDLTSVEYWNGFASFVNFCRGIFLPWILLFSVLFKGFICIIVDIFPASFSLFEFIVFNPASCQLGPGDLEPGEGIYLIIIFIAIGIYVNVFIIIYIAFFIKLFILFCCTVNPTIANAIPHKHPEGQGGLAVSGNADDGHYDDDDGESDDDYNGDTELKDIIIISSRYNQKQSQRSHESYQLSFTNKDVNNEVNQASDQYFQMFQDPIESDQSSKPPTKGKRDNGTIYIKIDSGSDSDPSDPSV